MQRHINEYESANPIPMSEAKPSLTDSDHFEMPLAQLPETPEAELYTRIRDNLADILRGEIDVLSLLFTGGNKAEAYYNSASFRTSNETASTYIRLLVHKDQTIKILEVGAGTGGLSAAILDKLTGNSEKCQLRCGKNTYTDISTAFFETAANRFRAFDDVIEFKAFNLEADLVPQGFGESMYDVVVASAVLHAASIVSTTLRNVHKLLKPNGKLVFVEPSNPTVARIGFLFGLLPGWWLSGEEDRYWSPLLSEEAWDDRLREAGFDGADVLL
ncbi:S-adenosyl-L-methionine-dependent methyltransferase [Aspergillus spectabilis]